MFYKHDTSIITILLNVYEHLKKNYDYLLIIVGDTGTGKSHLGLQLLETWNQLILKKSVTKETAQYMASDYKVWLRNFNDLQQYEMNIYDEGATSLDSKDFMTKLSRDLSKLFNVFRAKKFFSVIILPSYFDLNKYFREKRLRGLIWVDKRGHYKFYTKIGINFLNAYNEKSNFKSMYRAHPVHESLFPEYNGCMLRPYEKEKEKTINGVLNDIIDSIETPDKLDKLKTQLNDKILEMLNKGETYKNIQNALRVNSNKVSEVKNEAMVKGKLKINL